MRTAVLLALALAAGCTEAPTGPVQEGEADLDDGQLAAGKADGDPCIEYDAGSLDGSDLLTLVDKSEGHQLTQAFVPPGLAAIPKAYMMSGRTGQLRDVAIAAFIEMADAAKAESHIALRARSPYRSFVDQCVTMNYYRRENGEAYAKAYVAPPGRSQHQLGTAVDITSVNNGWHEWLAANAPRFGFVLSYPEGQEAITGYNFEPWHYRFIGKAAAAELVGKGMILEEYLQACEAVGAGNGDGELTCPRP